MMRTCLLIQLTALIASVLLPFSIYAENSSKMLLAHYMPWYESKPISGNWGWHWTMQRFDPEVIQENGQLEIASHYYPLLGPYDSSDPHVLECQVLLMKFSGIDGVIIDWYGTKDFRDYAFIHRCTESFIEFVKKAGLKFAICYEDRTIRPMVNTKKLEASQDVSHAAEVMQWVASHWFSDEAYVKVKDRPILPVFGPMYFRKAEQWKKILSDISPAPLFYALPHLAERTGSDGVFGWPPVHGGKEIPYDTWMKYLTDLYSRKNDAVEPIAVVFPKFHDIYEKSYGSIDGRGGATFQETLDLAWKSSSPLIQIATWNDYGEGTIIEPTVEFGYQYLEVLRKSKKKQLGSKFVYTSDDLRLPMALYKLRRKSDLTSEVQKDTDRLSHYLFADELDKAKALLENLENYEDDV